jgi:hypothetical protein
MLAMPLVLWAAVVVGTNCGFVASAPVADPSGSTVDFSADSRAMKDTSPAGATSISEIGWWCDTATDECNYEVGIYDHNATDDLPYERLFVDATNAKGTDAGWKTVAVDWAISAETIYWIAVQCDVSTGTDIDYGAGLGRNARQDGASTLSDPWPTAVTSTAGFAIYAKYETAGGGGPAIMAPRSIGSGIGEGIGW